MIVIHNVTQGSDAWHQLREGKYTGSNADKLLKHGAIPYSQATKSSFEGNFWTKRGHILEVEAVELYERIRGVTVERPGAITNPKYPKCIYSPDGLLPAKVIEVKCFDRDKHLRVWHGDITLEIKAQVHFGMLICERPAADLIIYNPMLNDPKQAFKIIPIEANPKILANMKKRLTVGG